MSVYLSVSLLIICLPAYLSVLLFIYKPIIGLPTDPPTSLYPVIHPSISQSIYQSPQPTPSSPFRINRPLEAEELILSFSERVTLQHAHISAASSPSWGVMLPRHLSLIVGKEDITAPISHRCLILLSVLQADRIISIRVKRSEAESEDVRFVSRDKRATQKIFNSLRNSEVKSVATW